MFNVYKRVTSIVLSMLEGNGLIVSGQRKHYRFYCAGNVGSYVTLARKGIHCSQDALALIFEECGMHMGKAAILAVEC